MPIIGIGLGIVACSFLAFIAGNFCGVIPAKPGMSLGNDIWWVAAVFAILAMVVSIVIGAVIRFPLRLLLGGPTSMHIVSGRPPLADSLATIIGTWAGPGAALWIMSVAGSAVAVPTLGHGLLLALLCVLASRLVVGPAIRTIAGGL